MLFKRYSNPFSLLDNLIITNQFSDFIDTFNDKVIEDLEFELWLNTINRGHNKSFEEFRKNIHMSVNAQQSYMSEDEVKTTIKKSNEILSDFKPY